MGDDHAIGQLSDFGLALAGLHSIVFMMVACMIMLVLVLVIVALVIVRLSRGIVGRGLLISGLGAGSDKERCCGDSGKNR